MDHEIQRPRRQGGNDCRASGRPCSRSRRSRFRFQVNHESPSPFRPHRAEESKPHRQDGAGMAVADAVEALRMTHKKAARLIEGLLRSAIANTSHNLKQDPRR